MPIPVIFASLPTGKLILQLLEVRAAFRFCLDFRVDLFQQAFDHCQVFFMRAAAQGRPITVRIPHLKAENAGQDSLAIPGPLLGKLISAPLQENEALVNVS